MDYSQIFAFMIVDFSLAPLEERLRIWQVLSSYHPSTNPTLRRLKLRLKGRQTAKLVVKNGEEKYDSHAVGNRRPDPGKQPKKLQGKQKPQANITQYPQFSLGIRHVQPRRVCILAFHLTLL